MNDSAMSLHSVPPARLQSLTDRLGGADGASTLTHLPSQSGRAAPSFTQRALTVLCIVAETNDADERDSLLASAAWMAARHHGTVDRFHENGLLVFFETPERCLPMAMNLQRSTPQRCLRMGIHSGVWDVASLAGAHEGEVSYALLGAETAEAERTAASAAIGSIVISPQAYALVQHDIRLYSHSCILTEEFEDSGFATASLTPAPSRGGAHASTFAGLGLT